MKLISSALMLGALLLAAPYAAHAQLSNAPNGVYRDGSTGAQFTLVNGLPASDFQGENIVGAFENIEQAYEDIGVDFSYSFESDGPNFAWTFSLTSREQGEPVEVAITTRSIRESLTNNGADTVTEVRLFTQETRISGFEIPGSAVNLYRVTSTYTYQGNGVITVSVLTQFDGDDPSEPLELTYTLTANGTGNSQADPIIPIDADWEEEVRIWISTLNFDETIWADPPYAAEFIYRIDQNVSEGILFSHIELPTDFGNVEVFISPQPAQPMVSIGVFGPGLIDLRDYNTNTVGAADFRIVFQDVFPDLALDAPYPVGLRFEGVGDGQVAVDIQSVIKEGPEGPLLNRILDEAPSSPADANSDAVIDSADVQTVTREGVSPSSVPSAVQP